jgi:hypothetical protein
MPFLHLLYSLKKGNKKKILSFPSSFSLISTPRFLGGVILQIKNKTQKVYKKKKVTFFFLFFLPPNHG